MILRVTLNGEVKYNGAEGKPSLNRTNKTVETLKKLGAEVKEVSLPYTKYAISTYYIISSAEAASNLSRYDGVRYGVRKSDENIEQMYVKSRTEGFGDEVKRRYHYFSQIESNDGKQNVFCQLYAAVDQRVQNFVEVFCNIHIV